MQIHGEFFPAHCTISKCTGTPCFLAEEHKTGASCNAPVSLLAQAKETPDTPPAHIDSHFSGIALPSLSTGQTQPQPRARAVFKEASWSVDKTPIPLLSPGHLAESHIGRFRSAGSKHNFRRKCAQQSGNGRTGLLHRLTHMPGTAITGGRVEKPFL